MERQETNGDPFLWEELNGLQNNAVREAGGISGEEGTGWTVGG